ncbi:hypothetical protein [Streptosporangium carneum]|uniref:Uncharacterized protein n=1 Tax=Streptosporangium carneum TaxID=47481 RepID=A0A9W6I8U3_9ACTN|nr:hypothetical protein [Streptosporangium carneum]GLK13882.1 hypothetical protein GCM10017600_72930 [Streptosporangium carneum]
MACDDGLADVVTAVLRSYGLPGARTEPLAGEALRVARARGLGSEALAGAGVRGWNDLRRVLEGHDEELRATAESVCACVNDVLFSSPRWRREVGYEHPMDELR